MLITPGRLRQSPQLFRARVSHAKTRSLMQDSRLKAFSLLVPLVPRERAGRPDQDHREGLEWASNVRSSNKWCQRVEGTEMLPGAIIPSCAVAFSRGSLVLPVVFLRKVACFSQIRCNNSPQSRNLASVLAPTNHHRPNASCYRRSRHVPGLRSTIVLPRFTFLFLPPGENVTRMCLVRAVVISLARGFRVPLFAPRAREDLTLAWGLLPDSSFRLVSREARCNRVFLRHCRGCLGFGRYEG